MDKRITAVDIERNIIKIAEIDTSQEQPRIVKNTTLRMRAADENGAFISVENLVREICETMEENGITAKNVRICSPFFSGGIGIESEEKQPFSASEFLHSKPFESSGNGHSKGRKSVGTLKKDGKTNEYSVCFSVDEFLVSELKRQFLNFGKNLQSVQYTQTALMSLSKLSPHTYDTPDKIIISFEDNVTAFIFSRDIPTDIRRWNGSFTEPVKDIPDFVLRDNRDLRLKHPQIILCGTKLSEQSYNDICDELAAAGFTSVKLPVLPDFAACYGLALKTGFNLLPPKTRLFSFPKLTDKAKKAARIIAGSALGAAVMLCAFDGVKIAVGQTSAAEIPRLESEIETEREKLSVLSENIEAASKSASKLPVLLDFLRGYERKDVFIASADTENMLPVAATDTELDGLRLETIEEEKNSNRVVIRGYALSGKAALDFYDALQKAEFDAKMNGVQSEKLPSGENVTIFEAEVLL